MLAALTQTSSVYVHMLVVYMSFIQRDIAVTMVVTIVKVYGYSAVVRNIRELKACKVITVRRVVWLAQIV
jgi:hypothetical protein